jgi:hypothetical protein
VKKDSTPASEMTMIGEVKSNNTDAATIEPVLPSPQVVDNNYDTEQREEENDERDIAPVLPAKEIVQEITETPKKAQQTITVQK